MRPFIAMVTQGNVCLHLFTGLLMFPLTAGDLWPNFKYICQCARRPHDNYRQPERGNNWRAPLDSKAGLQSLAVRRCSFDF
jgi:hypothetical protein